MMLDLLPARLDSAAGNMAVDFLLLQRYSAEARPRFRHYGWHRPAMSFGFSQKIADVRFSARAAGDEGVELCRRPTGGGMVDHRDDWTYALVLPRGHPLYDARAIESYRAVHAALAAALRELGCPAELEERPAEEPAGNACAVCFQRAERFDVVHAEARSKIAGAAQKRNKRGLLLQGSVWRPAAEPLPWDLLHDRFAAHLGRALAAEPVPTGWDGLADEEVEALAEQYASPEWLERR